MQKQKLREREEIRDNWSGRGIDSSVHRGMGRCCTGLNISSGGIQLFLNADWFPAHDVETSDVSRLHLE